MTSVPFPLRPGKSDVEFRFTTKTTRQLERAAGSGIGLLLASGRTVDALVLCVCYGLRWKKANMTEELATDWIDEYLEAGGKVKPLSEAVYKALNESGVYGETADESKNEGTDGNDAGVDPTLTATTAATSPVGAIGPSASASAPSA